MMRKAPKPDVVGKAKLSVDDDGTCLSTLPAAHVYMPLVKHTYMTSISYIAIVGTILPSPFGLQLCAA